MTEPNGLGTFTCSQRASPSTPLACSSTQRFGVSASTTIARFSAASYAAGHHAKGGGEPAAPPGIRATQCGVPPSPLAFSSAHTAFESPGAGIDGACPPATISRLLDASYHELEP